ncbi:MAG: biopolymer transporter ExbD [Flavobacteriales bacterium]|nr:biopolymer transporter ExbD [Flavobacteriales bacterium]
MARKKREIQEINAGSMADIAFLLLIFFLVTTTMDVDTGLVRVLPPYVEEPPEDQPDVNKRNVFVVLANANDMLLVEDDYMQIEDLKDAAKEFIIGKPGDQADMKFPEFEPASNKPESYDLVIKYWGPDKLVSKQIVSLQNDRGTSYNMYILIQDALASAYQEVRDQVAKERFGKSYDELQKGNAKEQEEAKAVKALIPQRISEAEPKEIGSK